MTGNIGEWSELYTLFKLLADGKLYAADAEANRLPNIYYDILKIIRAQAAGTFEYHRGGVIKVVSAESGEEVCSVPIEDFVEQASNLLAGINRNRSSHGGAFDLPDVWQFAESVKCTTLKAKSTDKSDIKLMVHDIMSGRDDTFGFSIKSQLGRPATLLNASGATNFIYKVIGNRLNDDEVRTINGIRRFKDKFEYLSSHGSDLQFCKAENETLEFNLEMVTREMPEIFAEMIKCYYRGLAKSIPELTALVANSGIFNTINNAVYYAHKVKELLTNIALGMVPNTLWTGDYEATGGFIIVKEDGDVVCYHIYNRNSFKNYIFAATRFDTPDPGKHKFGKIYDENGQQMMKLNVQIRFLK